MSGVFDGESQPLLGAENDNSKSQSYVDVSDGQRFPASPTEGKPWQATHVYKKRWYILAVYSLISFTLGVTANTFGSVALASEEAFGWTNADIALLYNWRSIAFILSVAIFMWIIDVQGLRLACLLCTFFMALGSIVRCLSVHPPISDWTIHMGQLLISCSTPVVYSAVSPISVTWFPVQERTTATAVPMFCWGIGSAFCYLLGPLLVPVRTPDMNSTVVANSTLPPRGDFPAPHISQMRQDLRFYLLLHFILSAIVFMTVIVHFPAKPFLPPSISASIKRTEFTSAICQLLRNGRFWILGIVYAATNGLWTSLAGVLEIDLKGIDATDSQGVAGRLMFYAVIAVLVVGVLVARIADHWKRKQKAIVIGLCFASTIFFLWFSLILQGIIPTSVPMVYASFILGSVTINVAVPMFYELSCEVTYPVSEAVTNGVLNLLNNVFCLVFYFVLMIPDIGTNWMNWLVTCALALCVPILIPYKQEYKRLRLDADTGRSAPAADPTL